MPVMELAQVKHDLVICRQDLDLVRQAKDMEADKVVQLQKEIDRQNALIHLHSQETKNV